MLGVVLSRRKLIVLLVPLHLNLGMLFLLIVVLSWPL
uniref:Uncharacterized protein n=1 Tax=Rhizophora mucronata TaxID=61149 RepID=A0A2P2LE31_RHIMU